MDERFNRDRYSHWLKTMQKNLFLTNLYWCMDNQRSSLGSSNGNHEDGRFMAGTNADDMRFEASTSYSRVNYKH